MNYSTVQDNVVACGVIDPTGAQLVFTFVKGLLGPAALTSNKVGVGVYDLVIDSGIPGDGGLDAAHTLVLLSNVLNGAAAIFYSYAVTSPTTIRIHANNGAGAVDSPFAFEIKKLNLGVG